MVASRIAFRTRLTTSGYSATAVEVTRAGADRIGRDRHPLQDAVRVTLEDAAIHERARIALIPVADHVLADPIAFATVFHLRPAG